MPSKRIGVHCAYFLQLILFLPVVETRQVWCKAPKSHFDTTGTLLNLNPSTSAQPEPLLPSTCQCVFVAFLWSPEGWIPACPTLKEAWNTEVFMQ